jgi:hypothetical protein
MPVGPVQRIRCNDDGSLDVRYPKPIGRAVPIMLGQPARWTIGAVAVLLTACASHRPVQPAAAPGTSTRQSSATQPPACRAGQLDARFLGGGYGTGNDFGVLVSWNPGPTPCQLHGPVSFAGYYPDGSRDRNAGLAHPIPGGTITVPGGMPPPQDGQDLSGYLAAYLMGTERDDASQPNALCRRQDEASPATLVLSIGSVTIRTANTDPGSAQVTSVYGCYGRVLLENLQAPG